MTHTTTDTTIWDLPMELRLEIASLAISMIDPEDEYAQDWIQMSMVMKLLQLDPFIQCVPRLRASNVLVSRNHMKWSPVIKMKQIFKLNSMKDLVASVSCLKIHVKDLDDATIAPVFGCLTHLILVFDSVKDYHSMLPGLLFYFKKLDHFPVDRMYLRMGEASGVFYIRPYSS